MDKYELLRVVSRSNGVLTKKDADIRRIKERIKRDFIKSIDAEYVLIGQEKRKQMLLVTRDKGDERIKRIKSIPDEDFNLGDIINWNGVDYLVYVIDADRRIQTKGRMYQCNASLRWRNNKGEIVERVGKAEDATKYSEGTQGGNIIRTGEFQAKILVPLDEETVLIQRDDRFMIDSFDFIDTMLENDVRPNVFRVTRRNVVTGTMPNIGYIEITLVEDQYVDGHDDIENRLACKRRELVQSGEVCKDSATTEGNVTEDKEGWL